MDSFERPAVFKLIQQLGNVSEDEMRLTFNLGVGMVVVVPPGDAAAVIKALEGTGERAWEFGTVIASDSADAVQFHG